MGCLKRPLHNFMITCHIKELMENDFEFNEDSGAAAVENSMPPEIPMRSQLDTISDDLIKRMSRETDMSRIVYLNLFNNKIKKCEQLCYPSCINFTLTATTLLHLNCLALLPHQRKLSRFRATNHHSEAKAATD